MTRLRIAVSLGNAPQMLRGILLEALEDAPEVEVLEGGEAADTTQLDAMIVSGHKDPESLLRGGSIRQVIDIERDGLSAVVHWLEHRTRAIDDLGAPLLLRLVAEDPAALTTPDSDRGGVSAMLQRLLRSPPSGDAQNRNGPDTEVRPPHQSASDRRAAIAYALGRLASRVVASRTARPARAGPAAELEALAASLTAHEKGPAPVQPPGLEQLATLFGLNETERDLLFISSVVEVDPRAARLVALLNDHLRRPYPTLGLVADLGGDPLETVERLINDGPLRRFDLATLEGEGPIAEQAVMTNPDVWPLMFGMDRRPPFKTVALVKDSVDDLVMTDTLRDGVRRAMDRLSGLPDDAATVMVIGDPDVGREDIARAIAARLKPRALIVPGSAVPAVETLAPLERELILSDAALILTEPETLDISVWSAATKRLRCPVLVTAKREGVGPLALASKRQVLEIEGPRRDWPQRTRLWQAHCPGDWSGDDVEMLADRFDFGKRQILSALSLASARAATDGRTSIGPADAQAASDTLRSIQFGSVADRVECPFEPTDIVLKPETRRELDLAVAWARHHAALFGADGKAAALHAGGGLACLFSGPPGTGKTMAAQIIARQIDFALYRIDLSKVIDKYIGETEKHLSGLFDEARRSRVALFFDEADALFGRRTEVKDSHDRYANITVDHLLQKLEEFDGLAILATNLSGNIDDAFMRRIRIRAEFAAPDAADRRRIWEKLLPKADERGADIDIALLADPFELVGGEIRNAIYTAHLLAADDNVPISMRHCVTGLWRELSKTGRISDLAHLGPWRTVVMADTS